MQLPLRFNSTQLASFNNYVPAPSDVIVPLVVQQILNREGVTSLFLYGGAGTGKTHLLHAACQQVFQNGGNPLYLPLVMCRPLGTDILEGLEYLDLICVDDVGVIAGDKMWETSLFHLFNRLREANIPQLYTGRDLPNRLALQLPDLTSRLMWGGVFPLSALDDDGKVQVLQERAKEYGMELSGTIARYLVNQCPHDLETLLSWLQKLDYVTLACHRKLTLPFVRHFLHELQANKTIVHKNR